MRGWAIAAAFVVVGTTAFAAGYDDYMRGYEARRVGNFDAALTAFTAALADGDLAPAYLPDAHIGRADALLHKGKCDEAAADLDATLSLRPTTVEALMLRARANSCLGKPDAALADIDAAIAVAPATGLYAYRADFRWFRGEFTLAAEDFLKAVKLQNKRAYEPREGVYSLLWYAITAARAKTYDAAAFAAAVHDLDVDDDEWPGPVMGFIRGKTKVEDIYRQAARGDGVAPAHQKCQADFFIGEWQVANGDPAGKERLQGMEQSCPKESAYLYDARRDLKRLP